MQEDLDGAKPSGRLLDDAPACLRIGQVGGCYLEVAALLADPQREVGEPA
jgi:hypothetical protein